MLKRQGTRLITGATPQQWLTIVLTLFVLLAAFILAYQYYLEEFVYEYILASRFEQRFGFRCGRVKIQTPRGEYSVYTLVEIVPGRALDRAGFRPGDVPSGWNHSQSVGFMRSLAIACEYPDREIFIGPINADGSRREQRRLKLPCVR